jgi:hypothetical protein
MDTYQKIAELVLGLLFLSPKQLVNQVRFQVNISKYLTVV